MVLFQDVIVTSSCSGALDIAVGTLSNAGQNILTPSPGFALYRCLLGAKLVEQRLYKTIVSISSICESVFVVITMYAELIND